MEYVKKVDASISQVKTFSVPPNYDLGFLAKKGRVVLILETSDGLFVVFVEGVPDVK